MSERKLNLKLHNKKCTCIRSGYKCNRLDMNVRQAIDVILSQLNREQLRRITAHGYAAEIDQIRLAIATRTGWDYQKVTEVAEQVHKLIVEKEIW